MKRTRMRGQGGALVKHEKGSIIPSRQEIIKDLVKYFFTEYGWDIAEKLFDPIPTDKLIDLAKKTLPGAEAAAAAARKGSGGGAIVLLALLAFAGGKKRRNR